jgi:DNA helicase HerA-like ATPase
MSRTFIVSPKIQGDIVVGSKGDQEKVLIGRLAEAGGTRKIWIGADHEFVALVVGKRGSGKSYTLGNILEGFATTKATTTLSELKRRRGVLLIDPMGNFWTMSQKVTATGTAKVQAQYDLCAQWGMEIPDVSTMVWLPAGFRTQSDAPQIQDFSIKISDLEVGDLADLIGANLLKDPQGAAIADAFEAVTQTGWNGAIGNIAANPNYSLQDLVDFLEDLRQNQNGGDHSISTLKAVIRSLRNLGRQPVFSNVGTPLTQLIAPGRLSVLMLPHRVGADLRRVITRLILRRTLREREEASQIQQRLLIENMGPELKAKLEADLATRIPRALLGLDEAQELLGDDGGDARKAVEDFCLLGRNYGLSLVLATQRPTAGAISAKVRSQADIQLIHRLLTQDDIEMAQQNLLAGYPQEVRIGDRPLLFADLTRELDRGRMIVSCSQATAEENINRIMIAESRPRVTIHGGEVT